MRTCASCNLGTYVTALIQHADSSRARHIAELFVSIFASPRAPRGVSILATCQSQTSLHPLLSLSHLFASRLLLTAPNKDARRDVCGLLNLQFAFFFTYGAVTGTQILSRIVRDRLSSSDIAQDPVKPLNYTSLATLTDGYSATDLGDLVGRAINQAAIRSSKEGQQVSRGYPLVASFLIRSYQDRATIRGF